MDTTTPALSDFRDFDAFVDYAFDGIGYKTTRDNLGLYVQSRLLTIDRKNSEVSGAHLAPAPHKADAYRQKLTRSTLNEWPTEAVTERLWALAYQIMPNASAWIIDSSGIPKKGDKSVGVAHQYCGELGKLANCQVLVSVHLSTSTLSLPLIMDLFLPEEWAFDPDRRAEVGVPEDIEFRSKPQMAVDQIDRLLDAGCAQKVVVADADFGANQEFRKSLQMRGLEYMGGTRKNVTVMRPNKLRHHDQEAMSLFEVAKALPDKAFCTITWREGTKGELSSRFAALRVVPAQGRHFGKELEEEQWLLIEWPEGEKEPRHYWFSNLSQRTSIRRLVRLAMLRWRIERDYQDLKQELGLKDYQGRMWRGFHHHLSCAWPRCTTWRFTARFFPLKRAPSIGRVRRNLEEALMERLGHCIHCRRPYGPHESPPPTESAELRPRSKLRDVGRRVFMRIREKVIR
nr:IS701 family transposase [Persicimonas caeni]